MNDPDTDPWTTLLAKKPKLALSTHNGPAIPACPHCLAMTRRQGASARRCCACGRVSRITIRDGSPWTRWEMERG